MPTVLTTTAAKKYPMKGFNKFHKSDQLREGSGQFSLSSRNLSALRLTLCFLQDTILNDGLSLKE